jgi:hypothetical protein
MLMGLTKHEREVLAAMAAGRTPLADELGCLARSLRREGLLDLRHDEAGRVIAVLTGRGWSAARGASGDEGGGKPED